MNGGTMQHELEQTARALVAEGKGILAADESDGTIKKRFDSIEVESTEDNRRAYRELLFATEGAEEFISGVILFDETLRQSAEDGTPFPQLLESRVVIPGIKVDKGAKPLALTDGETITEGLDGLRERLQEYRELGARFAKWRAKDERCTSLSAAASCARVDRWPPSSPPIAWARESLGGDSLPPRRARASNPTCSACSPSRSSPTSSPSRPTRWKATRRPARNSGASVAADAAGG